MKKRIISLFLVAILVFSFVGCSKEDKKGTESTKEGNATGDNFQVYKIGGIGPVTGDAATYGIAVKNAAELAVKEINAAADAKGSGIKFEFKFEDDVHNQEKAVNAYNSLKDWGMQILMGTVTSAPCEAVIEHSKKDNIFQMSPSASSKEAIKYDNVFRICFSDPDQGAASAKYIGEHELAKKVAIIYDSSDVYSTGLYETFAEEAKNQPFEIVSTETFTEAANTDFSVQIQKAKESGADLVFLPIYYKEASLILAQASKAQLEADFFGCDGLDGILAVKEFDVALAEGVMLLTPFAADAEDKLTKTFVENYKASFNETPNQFAADGYDAIYAIKAAIEKADITPKTSISDIGTALSASILEVELDGVTGLKMTWTKEGEPNKAPKAVIISEGSYKAIK